MNEQQTPANTKQSSIASKLGNQNASMYPTPSSMDGSTYIRISPSNELVTSGSVEKKRERNKTKSHSLKKVKKWFNFLQYFCPKIL